MTQPARRAGLAPWSMILSLGLVSLAIDMVSDGAISVGGVFLEQLGATAVLVGLVTGGAEALALVLRLVTGPWADRTRAYWAFTIAGYGMSAVSVPLLALSPFLGGAGLAVASVLILLERTGKAVRAPATTVLLAEPAAAVGLGKGFGVHKVLDQVGAFAGPLVVAGVAAVAGALWPAFLVLIVPAVFAMGLLAWLRARVPDVRVYRSSESPDAGAPSRAPRRFSAAAGSRSAFVLFAIFAALTEFGLLSFGVISFHLADAELAPVAAVPLVYALGMALAAVAAAGTGWAYDRWGPLVLLAVPVMTAFVPGLVFGATLPLVLAGVVIWGAATGVQDSTVKALVADLVPEDRRGAAYGLFSVFQGAGAFAGATVAGVLYGHTVALVAVVGVPQAIALVLLLLVLRRRRVRA